MHYVTIYSRVELYLLLLKVLCYVFLMFWKFFLVGLSCCLVWFPPVGVCCLCGLLSFVVLQLSFLGLLLLWYVLDVFGSSIGRVVVF